MTNNKFWLEIMVLIMIFGMTIIGCDEGNGKASSNNVGGGGNNVEVNLFIGTWRNSTSGVIQTITLNANLSFSWVIGGNYGGGTYSGTYSYNGNTAILTMSYGGAVVATLNNNGSSFSMGGGTWTKL